jgi:hypothetical protein
MWDKSLPDPNFTFRLSEKSQFLLLLDIKQKALKHYLSGVTAKVTGLRLTSKTTRE